MAVDIQPLITALQNKLQVTLTYLKATSGEVVVHTLGLYEIGPNKTTGKLTVYGWDTALNDHIRGFLADNIQSFQVLQTPFIPNGIWPLKLNGEIIG